MNLLGRNPLSRVSCLKRQTTFLPGINGDTRAIKISGYGLKRQTTFLPDFGSTPCEVSMWLWPEAANHVSTTKQRAVDTKVEVWLWPEAANHVSTGCSNNNSDEPLPWLWPKAANHVSTVTESTLVQLFLWLWPEAANHVSTPSRF